MTASVDSAVYVVYWNGDEDCDGRNDGPVAVFGSFDAAWEEANRQAENEAAVRGTEVTTVRWTGDPLDWKDAPGLAIKGERCLVRVATLPMR